MSYFGLIVTFAIANNALFVYGLGVCPCLAQTKRLGDAVSVGMASLFIVTCTAALTSLIDTFLIADVPFLRPIVFILTAAGLVKGLEAALPKVLPALHRRLGASLPVLAANCAVVGIALLIAKQDFGLLESLAAGLAAGAGMLLSLVLVAAIREKLEMENVPRSLRGTPIAFITSGLLALVFMALDAALLKHLFV